MTNMIQQAAAKRAEAPETAITQQQKPKKTIKDYVQSMSKQISLALPANLTPERFQRIVLTAISSNPKLQECTPQSFLGAMMTAAQLGIEPNTPLGQGYLIPRKAKKDGQFVDECTFQLGYKGLIDLAYRSGDVVNIGAQTVYANDKFHVTLGLDSNIEHEPTMGDRGDPIAFYAYYKTRGGAYGFEYMTVADARAHAKKFSEAVKKGWSSPWDTNFEEMAKKTVLKKALKYAPLSTEVASKISMDETVHETISPNMMEEPVVIDGETGEILNGEEAKTE